jgi:hypothetical protein
MKTTRVQIHSDIHLEKYPHRRILPKTSTLILAGDIGVPLFASYKSFFSDTSRSFDRIYYVLGNHEYERAWMHIDKTNYHELHTKFRERNLMIKDLLSTFSNITILDNQYTRIDGLLVFGGTLWSNFIASKKPIPTTKQYLSDRHAECLQKIISHPDLLITHYVSCASALSKPWSIGIGPKYTIPASRYIFGHIHYPISKSNVRVNPWGDRSRDSPGNSLGVQDGPDPDGVWDLQN